VSDRTEAAFQRILPLLDDLVRAGLPRMTVRAFHPVDEGEGRVRYDEVDLERPDVERVMARARESVIAKAEFREAAASIAQAWGISEDEAASTLGNAALGYLLYERDASAAARDISARLAKDPVLCTWKAHVLGLTTIAPLTFSDGSVLRPPCDDDRVRVEPEGMLSPMDEIQEVMSPSILELRFRSHVSGPAQATAERYFRFLRLICPAGISYSKLRILSPFAWLPMSRATFRPASRATPYTWSFDRNDVRGIDELREALWAYIPSHLEEPTDAIRIALDRYERALMEVVRPEVRILYLVMALEALYSESELEVGYRIRQRSALFSDLIGEDGRGVAKIVREAYKLRSSYVHGNLPNVSTFDILPLADLVRKTLVFLLVSGRGKEDFIRELDASAINDAEREKLRTRVRIVSRALQAPGRRAGQSL